MLHYLMYDDDDVDDVHKYEEDLYDFVEFRLSLEYWLGDKNLLNNGRKKMPESILITSTYHNEEAFDLLSRNFL